MFKKSWKPKRKKSSKKDKLNDHSKKLKQSTTPTADGKGSYATLKQPRVSTSNNQSTQPGLIRQKPSMGRKVKAKSVGYLEDDDRHYQTLQPLLDNLKVKSKSVYGYHSAETILNMASDTDRSDLDIASDNELEFQKSASTISSAFDVDVTGIPDQKDSDQDSESKSDEIELEMWQSVNLTEAVWTKQCNMNSFKDCYCIKRILYIMKYYHGSENKPTRYSSTEMKKVLNKLDHYDNIMLMNDYNHIKSRHLTNNYQLEESDDEEDEAEDDGETELETKGTIINTQTPYALIHEYFAELCLSSEPCEVDFCKCIQRNFRDRAKCAKSSKYRNDLYRNRDRDMSINSMNHMNENLNIVSKQLLDTIHCFIFHPQMRQNDGDFIDDEEHNKDKLPMQLFRPITISHYEHSYLNEDDMDDEEMEQKMNQQSAHKYKRSTLMSDALSLKVRHPTMSNIKFTIDDDFTPRRKKKSLFIQRSSTNLNLGPESLHNIINPDEKRKSPFEYNPRMASFNNTLHRPPSSITHVLSISVQPSISTLPPKDPTMNECVSIEELDEEEKQENEEEKVEPSYEFGINMIYDKDSREGRQNVFAIYKTFHEELLNNEIMAISQEQWQNCMDKACVKIKTVNGRHIVGKRGKFNGKSIELLHVMAIMLYCNYDELQRQFRSTYRRSTSSESDKDVRKRHSQYYWWGKLLNEAIYCFGDDIQQTNMCIYHGLQQKLLFSEFEACFYSPLSTTPSINVANTFQGSNDSDNGVILKLVKSQDYSAYYLNVSWLSDFHDEEERLFHCSHKGFYLHIHSLIHNTVDYRKYIASLNLLDQIINPDFFISYDHKPKKTHQKTLIKMIKYQLKQNKNKRKPNDKDDNGFVEELMEHFCASKISIAISLEEYDLKVFINKLAKYISELTISCEIFNLFPNMQQMLIEFIEYDENQLIKFMDNFLEMLNEKDNMKLTSIMFADINVKSADELQLKQMMSKTWQNLLEPKGWMVRMNDKYPGRMELTNFKSNTRQKRDKNGI